MDVSAQFSRAIAIVQGRGIPRQTDRDGLVHHDDSSSISPLRANSLVRPMVLLERRPVVLLEPRSMVASPVLPLLALPAQNL